MSFLINFPPKMSLNNLSEIYNLNFNDFIQNSFSNFLQEKKINNLSHEIINEFQIENYLSKNNIKLEISHLNQFRNLYDSNLNENPSFVKFLGQVENVHENQLFLAAKFDENNNKYVLNKYYNFNFENCDFDKNSIFSDRICLQVSNIKNLNDFVAKEFSYNKNFSVDKIFVYDYENKFSKINNILLILGIAYKENNCVYIHAWKIFDNYFNIKFESLFNNIKNVNFIDLIYVELKEKLLKKFNNDELLSNYLILFLFSHIFSRNNTLIIGNFPLNIILEQNEKNSKKINFISKLFSKISLFFSHKNLSISYLNEKPLFPIFNVEKEELSNSDLKLCDNSILLINELTMTEGKLDQIGIKNFSCIKNLIEFQTINYEFPFNNVEINHDIQTIIFSQKTKSIFNSPFLTILPQISNEINNNNFNENFDENFIQNLFIYVNYVRLNKKEFFISNEINEQICQNFTEKNKGKFKSENLNKIMILSRLFALSKGRNELNFSDYEFAYNLEEKRLERIENLTKKK